VLRAEVDCDDRGSDGNISEQTHDKLTPMKAAVSEFNGPTQNVFQGKLITRSVSLNSYISLEKSV
jgi:hypothetical protein